MTEEQAFCELERIESLVKIEPYARQNTAEAFKVAKECIMKSLQQNVMKIFNVHIHSDKAETNVLAFAPNPDEAIKLVENEAKQFPEFYEDIDCVAEFIGHSAISAVKIIWM